ncbi:MAG: type II toxin-antitoxin system RelE/ParE family toxin [Acidobacteriota bacterium]|nr:type II toxin-antitoxin system RelE/ParE family toxin [Acidobacteriota bacterium]
MRIEFTSEFKRNLRSLAKRYPHIRSDLEPTVSALEAGENPGVLVRGISQIIFKARAANSDSRKGRSGGYRVLYWIPEPDRIVLVTVYSKSDQGDVSSERIRRIIAESETEG